MNWQRLLRLLGAALLACALTLTASFAAAKPFVIASKKFPESALLAEILAQLLEQQGLTVERKLSMGNTAIVFENLKHGNIDAYPEYSGTAQQFLAGTIRRESADEVRRFVEQELRDRYQLHWGPPLGFNNTYAIAVRNSFAAEHQLATVSELARLSRQQDVRFVTTHEFLARDDGWKPLAKHYGLKGAPRGVEHGIAYELLDSAQADAMEVYASEGLIAANDIRLLHDDLGFFSRYDAAFIYGQKLASNALGLTAIAALAGRLSDQRMRALNHETEFKGRPLAEVARQFLVDEGLAVPKANGGAPRATTVPSLPRHRAGFFDLLVRDRALVLARTAQHLWLTLLALLASGLVGVPLGYLATRTRWLSTLALGGSNVVQTIPSLALLVFMIPVATVLSRWTTGLGVDAMEIAALSALFLYGLLPIVRNTKDGLLGVEPAVTEAARGLGMDNAQLLRHVLIPLAAPFILAGLRTSAVISTGSATLAAFVGAGGLGEAIISGLSVQNYAEVLTGAVPAAALALLFDAGFGLLALRFRRP